MAKNIYLLKLFQKPRKFKAFWAHSSCGETSVPVIFQSPTMLVVLVLAFALAHSQSYSSPSTYSSVIPSFANLGFAGTVAAVVLRLRLFQ